MADFGATELDAFAAEVRKELAAMYPPELRDPQAKTDPEAVWAGRAFEGSDDPQITWMHRMAAKGWTTPTWPKAYGGAGLTAEQARVIDRELAAGKYRPPVLAFGIWMLGPVLLEYADEAQKKTHLPRIVNGEIRWCQGYSEPGAGSDLAALATKCEDKGDHWLINGSKVWTSYADKADWCFCLVRTDASKKHEGISFVLIDMASAGVETRPIQLISGESPFCETFFTDVKIPKENLIGRVNGGWEIAKRLLQYERQNISAGFGEGGGTAGGSAGDLATIAKTYNGDDGELTDIELRSRITRNKMDFQSLRQTIARSAAESRAGNGPSAATSIIKFAAAELAKERGELMIEAMGHQGLGWEGEAFNTPEIVAVRGWLRAKANSIEGGTSEVNLNVIAKRVLGLPDPK
ncbi:MAG: acyl-CoA dehydrogenase family protein [Alphaproteobacteria bacterium]|nr:acyl-CoA dehydrogenase family protein [Alphaproteobacteria bacterium]MBU1514284.1 acyl-CoA dehydrogenase family protein [Alphaproteobacteria bacterium]MBU2097072.1 acyl-CoA dehydrogenase family protein [Alphaproteobacteria bacterium]MBU2152546.1 acyl-CoA dehydrogenase family protein [Alphaproteobacteria bacterium]MBU2308483.1 acyl-CoA dehydrogenase family protein [Alphaproteobacteria bacterium]